LRRVVQKRFLARFTRFAEELGREGNHLLPRARTAHVKCCRPRAAATAYSYFFFFFFVVAVAVAVILRSEVTAAVAVVLGTQQLTKPQSLQDSRRLAPSSSVR